MVTSSQSLLRRRRTREPRESQRSLFLLLLVRRHRTFTRLTQDQKPMVDRNCPNGWVAPKKKPLRVLPPLRAVLQTLYPGNRVVLGHRTPQLICRGALMVLLSTLLTC